MKIDHHAKFAEFCFYEKLTGGPDPHLTAVVKMSEDHTVAEALWRVACYVGVYNVPSAEAIWREWPFHAYLKDPDAFRRWLEAHWKGFRLRRERRTVKSPWKLSTYFRGYEQTLRDFDKLCRMDMEQAWSFALSLPHVGRYAATKLMECWYRLGYVPELTDIRAKGGWSPRKTLAMLYPEYQMNELDDSPQLVALAERLATEHLAKLRAAGHQISMFEMEVMLCEYKESIGTLRQYPGRSLDSELTYENAISPYWGTTSTEHLRIRSILHPHWSLGELNGWMGVRKELGTVLALYGYTWSDSLYVYPTDIRNPQRKETSNA